MHLVANWRAVMIHAWSVRLIALSILLSAAEMALPLLNGLLPVSPGVFAMLSFCTSVGAGFARVVSQKRLEPDPGPNWESGDGA